MQNMGTGIFSFFSSWEKVEWEIISLRNIHPRFLVLAVHAQHTKKTLDVTTGLGMAACLDLSPFLLLVHLSPRLSYLYDLTNLPHQGIPSEYLCHLHLKLSWF